MNDKLQSAAAISAKAPGAESLVVGLAQRLLCVSGLQQSQPAISAVRLLSIVHTFQFYSIRFEKDCRYLSITISRDLSRITFHLRLPQASPHFATAPVRSLSH